jgi:hypothetical protein
MSILFGDEAFGWSKLLTSLNSVRPIPHLPQSEVIWDGLAGIILGGAAFHIAVQHFNPHMRV